MSYSSQDLLKIQNCIQGGIKGCLDKKIPSLNFYHSIFITHHSIFHTYLASSPNFYYSIFFTLFVGPYLSPGAAFSFSFFSFQYPNSPKLKKKKKEGQKLQLVLFAGPSCVFNYKNAIELWVMETENTQNVFSVSITHNSKIKELSDEDRVMETELSFAKQPFCYRSHHFWVMSYGNRELSYENRQSKQPYSFPFPSKQGQTYMGAWTP